MSNEDQDPNFIRGMFMIHKQMSNVNDFILFWKVFGHWNGGPFVEKIRPWWKNLPYVEEIL